MTDHEDNGEEEEEEEEESMDFEQVWKQRIGGHQRSRRIGGH